jgi:DUF1365 family protein
MTVMTAPPRRIDRTDRATAAIYRGTVTHRRFGPVEREFTPKLFFAYLDVDALPESLDAIPFWSARRRAPVHFRRRDFFDRGTAPLGDAVRDLVEARIGSRPTGRVFLLAHLRTFGWSFNPLAVYYCFSSTGDRLEAVVLEVTNTPWGERCWYVFDGDAGDGRTRTPKAMHVSPYLPMDVDYHVTWSSPADALHLRLQVERAGTPVFEAELALRREPLDRRHGATVLARYPLMPLRVSVGIYLEALRIWLRRVSVHRHPATHAFTNPAPERPTSEEAR